MKNILRYDDFLYLNGEADSALDNLTSSFNPVSDFLW